MFVRTLKTAYVQESSYLAYSSFCVRQFYRNKRLVIIGGLLLVVAWGAWCSYFLPRGIEPVHEGFHASMAWRLAQGDLLFRDEICSSGTLVYWYESWILRIFPECGFLGLRIVWAVAMLLCALITARLMLKYFNPLVSFTAAAASLLFVSGVTLIKAPSYDTMPALPLLLAVWLWLVACRRAGKAQLLLAGGAGVAAFLATTLRFPLVPVVFLPILTVVYDRCSGVRVNAVWRMVMSYFIAYSAGVLCFFLVVGSTGLTDDLLNGFATASSIDGHGLDELAHRLIWSSAFILLPALVGVSVAAFFRYRENLKAFAAKHKKAIKHNILIIISFMIFIAILGWFYLHELDGFKYGGLLVSSLTEHSLLTADTKATWPILLLAVGIILADITFHLFDHVFNVKTEKDAARLHDRRRLGIMAIFLCLITIVGTGAIPPDAVLPNAWLLIALAVALSSVWLAERGKYLTNLRPIWILRGVCIVFLLLFLCYGILKTSHPWQVAQPVWEMSASPRTARLHGIITTPEQAKAMDSLVDAVESYSEPGDRILVCYWSPWLYYATHTLPSTYMTWLAGWYESSTYQAALDDMLARDRVPRVVVWFPWPWGLPDNPIDDWVKEHYEVVQVIDWHMIMLPRAALEDKGH